MIRVLSLIFSLAIYCLSLSGQTNHANDQVLGLIDHIQSSYDVYFSYESSLAKDVNNIDNNLDSLSLDQVLNHVFKNIGIHYLIMDDKYILLRKNQSDNSEDLLSIKGIVYSEESRTILPYASVYLKTKQSGNFTDDNGNFEININEADLNDTLVVSYIGFETMSFAVNNIESNIIIELRPKEQILSEVDVVLTATNRRMHEKMSLEQIDFIRTNQSAFFGNDPMKSLQFLPGVNKDGTISDVRIRGSQGQNTLIILDEIPILNIDHYYNIFSNINPLFVSSSELYKNNIPVEYGGKTAGLVKFNSSESKTDRLDIETNMLSSSVGLQYQFSEKMSVRASGRASYVDLFDNSTSDFVIDKFELATDLNTVERLDEPFEPDFSFYDFNINFDFQFNKDHTLEANFFTSSDDFGFTRTRIREVNLPNKSFIIDDTFSNTETWSNTGYSLVHNIKVSQDWRLKNVAYASQYKNFLNLNKTLFQSNDNSNFDERFNANLNNDLRSLGFKSVLNGILNDTESMTIGFEVKNHNASLLVDENQETFIDSNQEDVDVSFFQEFTKYVSESSRLRLGLRSTYLNLSNSFFLQPNISFTQDIGSELTFKSAFSRDVQGISELGFENRIGQQLEYYVIANQELYPVNTADKLMAGFTFQKARFLIDIEAYYKWENNILQLVSLESNGNGLNNLPASRLYDFFIGNGRSRGIDLLMSYQTEDWNTALSYTYSKTSQTFPDIYLGIEHLSPIDRRHQLQWINEYSVGSWTFSGSYIFQSGNPFIDLSQLVLDRDFLSPGDVQAFLPDYHRMDLGISYESKWKNNVWSLGFQVLNVLDNQNVKFNHQATNIKRQDQSIGVIVGNDSSMLERSYNLSFKTTIF